MQPIQRLNEAARIARALSLGPAGGAGAERTNPPWASFASGFDALPVTSYAARRQPMDAIDEITVQHEEATAIRTLLTRGRSGK